MTDTSLFANIPQEMKKAKRWLCYKLMPLYDDDGNQVKYSKPPVNPYNLYPARWRDSAVWSDFETAVSKVGCMSPAYNYVSPIDGIGFILGDGWAGVDLDRGPGHQTEGFTDETAKDILDTLKTYTEWSVSGNGFHLIGKYTGASLGECKSADGSVEIYTDARYLTVTGNLFGEYAQIADITETLPIVHQKYAARVSSGEDAPRIGTVSRTKHDQKEFQVTGSEIDLKAFYRRAITNAQLMDRLNGTQYWMKKFPNPSLYDYALMGEIIKEVGQNMAACIQVFRDSKYAKEIRNDTDKVLERGDYLARTYLSVLKKLH